MIKGWSERTSGGLVAIQPVVALGLFAIAGVIAAFGEDTAWRGVAGLTLLCGTGAVLMAGTRPPQSYGLPLVLFIVSSVIAGAVCLMTAWEAWQAARLARPDLVALAAPGLLVVNAALRSMPDEDTAFPQTTAFRLSVGHFAVLFPALILTMLGVIAGAGIVEAVLLRETEPRLGWVGVFLADPTVAFITALTLGQALPMAMATPPNRAVPSDEGTKTAAPPTSLWLPGTLAVLAVVGIVLFASGFGVDDSWMFHDRTASADWVIEQTPWFTLAIVSAAPAVGALVTSALTLVPSLTRRLARADHEETDRSALTTRFNATALATVGVGAVCVWAYEVDEARYTVIEPNGIVLHTEGGETAYGVTDVRRVEVACSANGDDTPRYRYELHLDDRTVPVIANGGELRRVLEEHLPVWIELDAGLRATGVPIISEPALDPGAPPRFAKGTCAERLPRFDAERADTALRLLTPTGP